MSDSQSWGLMMVEKFKDELSMAFSPCIITESPVSIGKPVRFSTRVSRKVSIKASHILPYRMSWSNMSLIVVSGKGRIVIGEDVRELSVSEALQIPPHCEHQIEAETDLRMVVTFDASSHDTSDP
ncbi:MAG: cupin domain-containing protein [Planctomycetaceae bacterium]|nr:cupin domain-containing protein [Planctomycetaceae bacterium]